MTPEATGPRRGTEGGQEMSADRPWLEQRREGSMALQGVLGALLEA